MRDVRAEIALLFSHICYYGCMPRSARIDAPGVLHHVIGRGIERGRIFFDDTDRDDFITRLAAMAHAGYLTIYAWALLPNHFHLLCKTRLQSLSNSMHRLLTGFAVAFNQRHRRHGHLFQNRFKSIVCQEDRYLKELLRYIHLNPLRSGLVEDLTSLATYPYCGHGALVGSVERDWQDSAYVLSMFANNRGAARRLYRQFVAAEATRGRKPHLVGGGLVRSLGGWSEVLALRHRRERTASDQRILGGDDFVRAILAQTDERLRQSLRLSQRIPPMETICRHICETYDVSAGELCSGSRRRSVVTARLAASWIAVRELGYSGAEVARHLGVTNSCITRSVASARMPDVRPVMERLRSLTG
jgi:putative transposase